MPEHPQSIMQRLIEASDAVDREDGTLSERLASALHGAGWLRLPTWDEIHGKGKEASGA